MTEPKRAGDAPMALDLEPGTYYWCRCGRSVSQPYCDGSHQGTGLGPERFELEEAERVAFCLCKQTGNAPRCDGSHRE